MKNIFVSSTFRDFHRERDLLRNSVLPEINRMAKRYGETVNFCDLRWGIDTEEEYENATTKVLSSCLDEIDRARPYMIVFLGDRYGYVPSEDIIAAEAQRRNINLESLDISVTQLEIEYGSLRNEESATQTLFYFREESQPLHTCQPEELRYQQKLAALKDRITRIAGNRVRYYSSSQSDTDEFVQMVTNDLLALMNVEWEKKATLSKYDLDNKVQWNGVKEKAASFCAHSSYANESISWFCSDQRDRLLVLTGEGGAGKSTCFSHICVSMRQLGWDVIPFMGGTTEISTDETEILKSLIWQLEDILGASHQEEKPELFAQVLTTAKLREQLQILYKQYADTGRKLLLAVDAIDQLNCVRSMDYLLFLPDEGTDSVSILLTARTDIPVPKYITSKYLPELTQQERQEVIESISRRQGRWLSPSILQQVVLRKESGNPLYLLLILNRLYLMDGSDYTQIETSGGGIEHINQRMRRILQQLPDSKEIFAVEFLRHIIQIIGHEELWECMCHISLSRAGLRSQDLEAILIQQGKPFIPYRFYRLINFVGGLFVQRNDGRYDFQHQVFRDGICAEMEEEAKTLRFREAAHYLLFLPQDDPVRMREITGTLLKAGMYRELYRYIQEIHKITEAAEFAQDGLYNHVKADNGWIVSRIQEVSEREDSWFAFLKFFLHHVSRKFLIDPEQTAAILNQLMSVREVLMEQNTALEDHSHSEEDIKLRYLLAWCCTEIGRIYKGSADTEQLQRGHSMLEQACDICRNIYETHGDEPYCAMELALSFMEIGDFLNELGVSEYQKKALELYRYALELEEAVVDCDPEPDYIRNLVVLYERISLSYCSERLGEDTPKGFAYMQIGVEQMERLIELEPTVRNREELANILSHLAQGYADRQDNDSLDKSIKLYHRVLQIRSEIYNEFHTQENASDLCDVHMSLCWVYRKHEDQASQKAALEHCLRAYELAVKTFQSRQLLKDERMLIRICQELGKTYMGLEGCDNLSTAQKYGKQALMLAEQYYSKMQNHSSFRIMLRSINYLTEINLHIDGEEALNESVRILENALHFLEDLNTQGRADRSLVKDMPDLYDRLGLTYEKLGGPQAQDKALEAYLQELKLSEAEWEKDKNNVEYLRGMEVCENKIGHLLISMVHGARIQEGIAYLEKALNTAKLLSAHYASDLYLWDLSYCYKLNSKALMRSDRTDDLRKAREYLLESQVVLEGLERKKSTDESRRSLMFCYSDLSRVCSRLQLPGEALDAARKACAIADAVVQQRNTGESVYEVSEIYGELAFCLFSTGDLQQAQETYTKSISYAKEGIQRLGTYRTYVHCIQMYIGLGDIYACSGTFPLAVSAYDAAIELVEKYASHEIPESYRTMCVDVYMALVERYEKMAFEGFRSNIILLYRKSIDILEPMYQSGSDKVLHSNLEHTYYGLAEVYLADGQYQNAIVFFKQYLQLYPEFDEQARSGHQRVLEYSCYSRIGVSNAMLGNIDAAIEYLRKAVTLQMEALLVLDMNTYQREVLEDQVRDCDFLGELYGHAGDKEQQLEFMKLEIALLERLSEIDMKQYSRILKNKRKALAKWNKKNRIKDDDGLPSLQRDAIAAYQNAEGEMVIGKTEQALALFRDFQALAEKLPKEKINGKLAIYYYNSFSNSGAILANRNTADDRKQAIQMYKKAIGYAIEAMKKTKNPFTQKEISRDIAADSGTLMMLCIVEGDSSTMLSVMEMMKDM